MTDLLFFLLPPKGDVKCPSSIGQRVPGLKYDSANVLDSGFPIRPGVDSFAKLLTGARIGGVVGPAAWFDGWLISGLVDRSS